MQMTHSTRKGPYFVLLFIKIFTFIFHYCFIVFLDEVQGLEEIQAVVEVPRLHHPDVADPVHDPVIDLGNCNTRLGCDNFGRQIFSL